MEAINESLLKIMADGAAEREKNRARKERVSEQITDVLCKEEEKDRELKKMRKIIRDGRENGKI